MLFQTSRPLDRTDDEACGNIIKFPFVYFLVPSKTWVPYKIKTSFFNCTKKYIWVLEI